MELNFSQKFSKLYEEESCKQIIPSKKLIQTSRNNKFHLDCKFSRKKICFCSQIDSSQYNKDFADFLSLLMKDEIEICEDPRTKRTLFKRKDQEEIQYHEAKQKLALEKLKNIELQKAKTYIRNLEENNVLSYSDYREIEKSINDDKKICENCKTNIYENNYHKGWKNEAGEYVLLCPMCSKRYFGGALDLQFGNRDSSNLYRTSSNITSMNSISNINTSSTMTSSIPNYSKIESSSNINLSRKLY
jgi:hypothetical protein